MEICKELSQKFRFFGFHRIGSKAINPFFSTNMPDLSGTFDSRKIVPCSQILSRWVFRIDMSKMSKIKGLPIALLKRSGIIFYSHWQPLTSFFLTKVSMALLLYLYTWGESGYALNWHNKLEGNSISLALTLSFWTRSIAAWIPLATNSVATNRLSWWRKSDSLVFCL